MAVSAQEATRLPAASDGGGSGNRAAVYRVQRPHSGADGALLMATQNPPPGFPFSWRVVRATGVLEYHGLSEELPAGALSRALDSSTHVRTHTE